MSCSAKDEGEKEMREEDRGYSQEQKLIPQST
jgi:hypothetical protein